VLTRSQTAISVYRGLKVLGSWPKGQILVVSHWVKTRCALNWQTSHKLVPVLRLELHCAVGRLSGDDRIFL
jgi:hypothetical protein